MVSQTEEALSPVSPTKQVGIGSVSSARSRGAMGSIDPTDATNALDVIAEDTKNSNNLKLNDSLRKNIESVLAGEEEPEINPSTKLEISPSIEPEINSSTPAVEGGLGSIRPKARPKPKRLSPIDKVLELNYLLKGKSDPNSKTTRIMSGLDQGDPVQQKTIKGFFDSAAGGKTGFDPTTQAWCAAFVSHILEELGADPLKSKDRYDRLRADKFKSYGTEVKPESIKEGDIVVFDFDQDGKADHVTFYAGDRITSQGMGGYINVLGGNQSGQVSIRENHPLYLWDNVAAVRRITYNDIDFDFTEEMAQRDPVFKEFMPDLAGSPQPSPATFNQGGSVMNNQMEMAFMKQGGIKDDGMKKDPVSGNEIPPGSMAKEVRDDIPAMLSEGEYVVPADVLRFYGVNFFEDLRNQAKSGLQGMEQNGRIGGEPLSPQQIQQNMGQAPAPVQANQGGMMQGFNQAGLAVPSSTFDPSKYSVVGGSTFNNQGQQSQQESVVTFKTFINSADGSTQIVEFVDGKLKNPAMEKFTQPPYYEQGSSALKKAQAQSSNNKDDKPDFPEPAKGEDSKDWGLDVDWSDPLAYANSVIEGQMGRGKRSVLQGLSALAGPVGVAAVGIGLGAQALGQVSNLRAAAELARAQGMDEEAKSIDGMISKFMAEQPAIVEFLDDIRGESNKNHLTVMDREGLKYTRDEKTGRITYTPEQKSFNKMQSTAPPGQTYDPESESYKQDDYDPFAWMENIGGIEKVETDDGVNFYNITDKEEFEATGGVRPKSRPASVTSSNKGGLMAQKKKK